MLFNKKTGMTLAYNAGLMPGLPYLAKAGQFLKLE